MPVEINKAFGTGCKTPVVLIIFNRPEATEAVLNVLKMVRPERLYVISDGPRPAVEGETEKVEACRALLRRIDWPCAVKKNFAKHNLGCGIRIASGLHWVFRHEEKAIILEDDTLPDLSFFPYCEELLSKYEGNESVMHINGRNNLGEWPGEESYFFSRTVNPWGWATWRRAWRKYDFILRHWSLEKKQLYQRLLNDEDQAAFYSYNEQRFLNKIIDTWDIQWTYSVFRRQGLSIVPKVNLVRNTGFHQAATHTSNTLDMRADHAAHALPDILKHPATETYSDTGRQFDRWNFLFEQLNGFKNPGILMAIYKMLENGQANDPGVQERYKDVIPFLYPLKDKPASRQLLLHLQPHLPGNLFLENLLKYF